MTPGEERLLRVYEALGYRRARDLVREWGAAHRGIVLLTGEEVAARIEAWLREQEGLEERGAAGAGERDRGELAVAAGEAAQGGSLARPPAAMWPGASTDRSRAEEEG